MSYQPQRFCAYCCEPIPQQREQQGLDTCCNPCSKKMTAYKNRQKAWDDRHGIIKPGLKESWRRFRRL